MTDNWKERNFKKYFKTKRNYYITKAERKKAIQIFRLPITNVNPSNVNTPRFSLKCFQQTNKRARGRIILCTLSTMQYT